MNRTLTQNKALHLYFTQLADKLNDSDCTVQETITVPIAFTSQWVKEYMFKGIMSSMFPDLKSSSELSTTQLQEVYEVMNAATADRLGVSIEFPNRFIGSEQWKS